MKKTFVIILCICIIQAFAEVTINPEIPVPEQTLSITYNSTGTPLEDAASVMIRYGYNGWVSPVESNMAQQSSNQWRFSYTVPADAEQIDFVFHSGDTWDNNDSSDWHYAKYADPSSYPTGSTITSPYGAGAVFKVWAPNATKVSVRGSFNGWAETTDSLTKDSSSGIWSGFVSNATDNDQYKFYITSSTGATLWKIDPYAKDTINTTDNGILVHDNYQWNDNDWQIPNHDDMVIYELHVGSFSGRNDGLTTFPGTFRNVVDTHLNDLKAAGVNMVEIMPIHEFPGGQSWGYNPVHFFAPESDYGSPEDLKYMVDTLHQNGIGVILDVVYNHVSNDDNNLWEFDGSENIYFEGGGDTDWGPRPNYAATAVYDFFVDNGVYWIETYHMDGLRLDATAAMHVDDPTGQGWNLMKSIRAAAKTANSRAIIIAEELPNDSYVTMPESEGGAGFDGQWCDNFHDKFKEELNEIKALQDPDLSVMANAIANSGFDRPNMEAIKFLENHDEIGNVEDNRINKIIDYNDPYSEKAIALSKVFTGLLLVSPGVPMLMQGQEFLEDTDFDDDLSHRIDWSKATTYKNIREFYRQTCQYRLSRGSLKGSSSIEFYHTNQSAGVFAFQRYDSNGDVSVVVANFSSTDFSTYNLGFPSSGTWYELLNSQNVKYDGTASSLNKIITASSPGMDNMNASATLNIPKYSLMLFNQTESETYVDTWSLFQ